MPGWRRSTPRRHPFRTTPRSPPWTRHARSPRPDMAEVVVDASALVDLLLGNPLGVAVRARLTGQDRKSTRLNSSHANISYAVFCLKKKISKHNYDYMA